MDPVEVFRFKIRLNAIEPEIWRRFDVPSNWSFEQFHDVIQVVMGWTDSHLHEFTVGGAHIGPRHSDPSPALRDEKRIKLSEIFSQAQEMALYLYDFGDGWEHSMILESIVPLEASSACPRCIAGELACPPEDCGGPFAFANMLEALRDPTHKDYRRWSEWIDDFDANKFSIETVNRSLNGLAHSAKRRSSRSEHDLSEPLTEAELTELDALLESAPEACFDLPALHGLLSAAVAGPGIIMPSRIFELAFGADVEEGREFKTVDEAIRAFTLMARLQNQIARELADDSYQPITWLEDSADEDRPDAESWCLGFMAGISECASAWKPLMNDKEASVILVPLFARCNEREPPRSRLANPIPDPNEFHAYLCDLVPTCQSYFRQKSIDPVPIHTGKIPRNTPCPCGSGKKYKHCCGRAAGDP